MSNRSRRPLKPSARFSKSMKTASDRSPSATRSPPPRERWAVNRPGAPGRTGLALLLELLEQLLGGLGRLGLRVLLDELGQPLGRPLRLAVGDELLGVAELVRRRPLLV